MNKTIWAFLMVFAMLFFASCTTKSPLEVATESGVSTAPNQAEVNACLQWLEKMEEKKMARYDSLGSNDKAFALMHHDTMDMIKEVWGKKKNECQPGTNVWDAYIAWVEAENKTKQVAIAEGGSTLRFASGVAGAAYTVTDLAAKVGDKVLGNKTEAGRDINQAGQGIENSGTNTAVTTRTEQTQVQAIRGNGNIEPAAATVQVPAPAPAVAETPPGIAEAPAVTTTP